MKTQPAASDRLLFVLLLALLVVAPLPFGANVPFGWAVAVIWSCLIMLAWLVLWAAGRVPVTKAFINAWPMHLLFALWSVWLLFQLLPLPISLLETLSPKAAWVQSNATQILDGKLPASGSISLDAKATQSAFVKTIGYLCVFNLVLLLVASRRRVKILAWTLVGSGLLQAMYGSFMTLSGVEYIFWYEKEAYRGVATGTFINRNHLAGYLVICLSVGIGLMLALLSSKRNDHWRARLRGWMRVFLSEKFRLRLFLVVMVIALVMTRSRMGNISFMLALLATGVIGLVFLQHARRSLSILVASIIVIDIVIVGAWFGIDKVMDRLEKSVVQASAEDVADKAASTDIQLSVNNVALLQERGLLYRDVKHYVSDFWLTGSGVGSFESVYPLYRGADIIHHYDHAHNDYYEFFAEAGAPGIILSGGLLLFPLLSAVVAMVRRRNRLAGGMAFAVVMSITALLLHSTVDFNLQIPAYAMTLMVILALAYIVKALPAQRRKREME